MEFLIVLALSVLANDSPASPIVVEDAAVKLIRHVRLPANEPGVLTEFLVKEGDIVEQDQLLAKSDDRLAALDKHIADLEFQVATEKSENDVDERYAEKSLAVAQSEWQLSAEAAQRVATSISATELSKLKLVVEQAKLAREQAQRDLRIAKLTKQVKQRAVESAQQKVELRLTRAPFKGMIVELMTQANEWVDPGQPILRIVQLDRLRVEVNLDGKRYGPELKGRPVKLKVALPPGDREVEFDGEVTFVSPELQPVTGQVRVWAEVINRDLLLRPGSRGTLTIRK
ncbi:putative efflux pump membrane fusion protein [Rosistilla ulvae]|uniref:Putative efflux pump membrane fusion protein n=2 Tax=Rosistilla ulvae TaxID=1930277 RepID=A0A517LYX0_9BACT|nr:putative efflux pump membrane fusion protein [Rosistilla ulvae]